MKTVYTSGEDNSVIEFSTEHCDRKIRAKRCVIRRDGRVDIKHYSGIVDEYGFHEAIRIKYENFDKKMSSDIRAIVGLPFLQKEFDKSLVAGSENHVMMYPGVITPLFIIPLKAFPWLPKIGITLSPYYVSVCENKIGDPIRVSLRKKYQLVVLSNQIILSRSTSASKNASFYMPYEEFIGYTGICTNQFVEELIRISYRKRKQSGIPNSLVVAAKEELRYLLRKVDASSFFSGLAGDKSKFSVGENIQYKYLNLRHFGTGIFTEQVSDILPVPMGIASVLIKKGIVPVQKY